MTPSSLQLLKNGIVTDRSVVSSVGESLCSHTSRGKQGVGGRGCLLQPLFQGKKMDVALSQRLLVYGISGHL